MGNTIKKILTVTAAAAITYALSIRPRTKYGSDLSVIARYDYADGGLHDFYNRRPEHSLPAVRYAMVNGYAVKLDIRLTKDGVPVAFPDHELFRICGADGSVEETAWSNMKDLTLQETEEPICTLADMLSKIDCAVPVILNLISWRDNYGSLCSCVSDALELYEGVYAIESADYRVLRWFKEYEPEVLRGQIHEKRTYNKKDLVGILKCFAQNFLMTNFMASPDFIAVDYYDRDSIPLKICRFLYQVPIICYNVTAVDEYETARMNDAIVVFEKIMPGE